MNRALLPVVLMCIVLVGCGAKSGKIVGKWKGDGPFGGSLEFTADNHLKISQGGNLGFTWYKIEGNQITVGHLTSGAQDKTETFSVSGNTLTIGNAKYRRETGR